MAVAPRNRNPRAIINNLPLGTMQTVTRVAGGLREALPILRDWAKKAYAAKQSKRQAPKQKEKQALKNLSAPVSQGFSQNSMVRMSTVRQSPSSLTVRGTTILASMTTPAVITSSSPMCVAWSSSNPVTFQDRLQTVASTYDKYVYKKVTLRYVPQVSTATSGTVIIAIDRDYLDDPQTVNLTQACSYESVASGSVWTGHSCPMSRQSSELRTYFTNSVADCDPRETEQFKFYGYAIGCPANTTLGYLVLDYELELISPVFAPAELSTNLSSLGMFQRSLTMSFVGSGVTINQLPFSRIISGAIYEVIIPYTAVGSANFTVGALGLPWLPSGTSLRLYVKAGTPTALSNYTVFLDYPSAVSGNPNVALTKLVAGDLTTDVLCTYRLQTGFLP